MDFSGFQKNSRGTTNPCDCFKYKVEERIQCGQSGQVRYTNRDDYILALPIPLESATNKDEVAAFEIKKKECEEKKQPIGIDEIVRPSIPLSVCLESFSQAEIVDDIFTVVQSKQNQLLQNVSIDIPDELDLSALRGKGLQKVMALHRSPYTPGKSLEPVSILCCDINFLSCCKDMYSEIWSVHN
ncbi:ubiquitin carboxyl-terminal hydrolase 13-like [Ptychodera flava]|uniref:ubiquitin carboxyl-terminal hydrolase 13-like n=1 Tax=Ptychodera flava TaxID=63121 RepID=UPI00396A1A7C